MGYDFYCVPEVPSLLNAGGAIYPGIDAGKRLMEFETALIKLQLQAEESFLQIAKASGKKSVVVFDRGLLDVAAYLPEDLWKELLHVNTWTANEFMERYDLVMHLESVASGDAATQQFYTSDNNIARTETLEEARALDRSMSRCWSTHPAYKVVSENVHALCILFYVLLFALSLRW
jgi:hypothetical protein